MNEREQGHRNDRKVVLLGRLVRGVTIVGGVVIAVGLVLALVGYVLGGAVGDAIAGLGTALAGGAFLIGLSVLFSAYFVTEGLWVVASWWFGGWFGGDDGGSDFG